MSRSLETYVDLHQPTLWISIASIIFNPTVWNLVARHEYRNKTMTKALGSPYSACYLMAFTIVAFGLLRDALFERALRAQPEILPSSPLLSALAVVLFVAGQTLVLSSTWALGVTGTYLGDYCGILQDSLVTGFPFNIQENPMYNGSTMCFLATSLWYRRPAGLLITAVVWIVYQVALQYEGPFTSEIYAARERKRSASSVSAGTASSSSLSEPVASNTRSRARKADSEL